MRGNEFLDKMSLIDPTYIDGAEVVPKRKRLTPVKKLLITAACFVLMFSVGLGGYTYAAEAIEYNNAIRFFDEYDLSTEGLTRTEIKSVYKDITTNSFSDKNTVIVIANNFDPTRLNGYVIPNENATPKDVEEFWNYRNSGMFPIPEGTSPIETPVETPVETPPETEPLPRRCQGMHKYELGIINEGSCTEERTMGNICVNCGWSYVTEKLGKVHTFGEYVVTVPMTCESDGLEVSECTGCGIKDEKIIPASHTLGGDGYYFRVESTCKEHGFIDYYCSVCCKDVREELPLSEHDWRITTDFEATCTKGGEKTGVCKVCDEYITFEKTSALGHDYKLRKDGDWLCYRCYKTHSEIHPTHQVTITVKKKATCTEEGYIAVRCNICVKSGETATAKLPHNNDPSKTEVIEATCISQGIIRQTCIDCGYVTVKTLIKKSHVYKIITDGGKWAVCDGCGLKINISGGYSGLLEAIDGIVLDGKKDSIYSSGFKFVSTADVDVVDGAKAHLADGNFEAYVLLGDDGMYIYAEIADKTPSASDYVKVYLDWCIGGMIHPSEEEKYKMEAAGDPWNPVHHRNSFGGKGLQYLGWLQGYGGGDSVGGLGFDLGDAVVYKCVTAENGWSCEWFIPWRDDAQREQIVNMEGFHIGIGFEVGDDVASDGSGSVAVKRYDRMIEIGTKYSEDYSVLTDLNYSFWWVYGT